MRKSLFKAATVFAAAATIVSVTASAASATDHGREIQQTVHVVGHGNSVTLDRHSVRSGSIRFSVTSDHRPSGQDEGGSDIAMFRPKPGQTLQRVFADFAEEFNPATAAKGTRDLVRDAVFVGLADLSYGNHEVVTENLSPGTYYLVDVETVSGGSAAPAGPPPVTTLTVTTPTPRIEQDSDLRSQVQVYTLDDRFHAPRNWPHAGTYTFTNRDDTIHFMEMVPVKPGTTDAQVQQALTAPNQSGPPSFLVMGPRAGNDPVSPGRSLQVTYDLPAGTYVLLCFVADDRTGMPHALMGMHQVVILR